MHEKQDARAIAELKPGDAAAAQAAAQMITDALVLMLCAVKAWLEALHAAGEGGGSGGGAQVGGDA